MHVFVTGASGFVGSAVVRELLDHGHTVLGLARSPEGAARVAAAGAEPALGSIADLDTLGRLASRTDGVIHTAFNHDFSRFAENAAEDARAIGALGAALEGSDRPLLVTGGVAHLAEGRMATERDRPPAPTDRYPRCSEPAVEAVAARGARATTVRLPPSVHGAGDHGFVPILIARAREAGVSAYVGEGANRWPAVHRLDAARLFRLGIEHGAVGGPYHAIAEDGVPFRTIAETIARRLGVPAKSLTPEEAAAHFGWFAAFAGADAPTSSVATQALLGWTPTGPTLIEDIDAPGYYA